MKKLSLVFFLLVSIFCVAMFSALGSDTLIKNGRLSGTLQVNASPTPGKIQFLAGSKIEWQPTKVISALDVDWSASFDFSKTLGANSTFTFSNTIDDRQIHVFLLNTASNYTVTWPAGIQWPGGAQPVQTTGAKTDEWIFNKAGSIIYGRVVQNFSVAVATPTSTATATATNTPTPTATFTPTPTATATFTPTPTATATATATATSTATVTATATATATVAPIIPTDLSGLVLWLKADAQSFSNNDPVGTWVDSSGTSNDATQSGSTLKPLFKTSIINSLPVVRFDGSNDYMNFGTDPGTTTTTFVVGTLGIAAGSQSTYAAFVITNNANGLRITARNTGTNWGTFVSADLDSGENLASGTFSVLEMTTTSGSTIIYRNGTQKATSGTHSSGGGAGNQVGGDISSGTRYLNGDIAEIIIYNSVLSSGNRAGIEQYLFNKYALP